MEASAAKGGLSFEALALQIAAPGGLAAAVAFAKFAWSSAIRSAAAVDTLQSVAVAPVRPHDTPQAGLLASTLGLG